MSRIKYYDASTNSYKYADTDLQKPIKFEKSSNYTYFFYNKRYKFSFQKQNIASTHRNNWDILGITCDNISIATSGTDIIGALLETGADGYIGGIYGNENHVDLIIIHDGILWDETSNFSADKLDVYITSTILSYFNQDDLFTRIVHLALTGDEVFVDQTYTCLKSCQLSEACIFGMFAINKNITSFMATNNRIITENLSSETEKSKEVTDVQMCWSSSNISGSISIQAFKNEDLSGYVGYITPLDVRYKAYLLREFDTPLSVEIGDILHGSFKYTFL